MSNPKGLCMKLIELNRGDEAGGVEVGVSASLVLPWFCQWFQLSFLSRDNNDHGVGLTRET